jgi:PKD repeat protein
MDRKGVSQNIVIIIIAIVISVIALLAYSLSTSGSKDTEPPIAYAGEDRNIILGESVTLNADGSTDNTGISDYRWELGDGETKTGVSVEHSYSEAGVYTVTLTVGDEAGNINTATVTITVAKPEDDIPPIADAGSDAEVTLGEPVVFDASGSSDNVGIEKIDWDFGDGITASGSKVQHEYKSTGKFTVTLTVSDAAGNTDEDTLEVTIAEAPPVQDKIPPNAEAGLDITTIIGETVVFDASQSSDNVGITSYNWEFGDDNSESGVTVSHTYIEVGNYTVTLTVIDEAGNSDSDTLTVSVTQPVVTPTIDGTVEAGEYPHSMRHSATGIVIHWYNDNNDIIVGMISPGNGWVTVGFDPGFAMSDANFIFGYVSGGEAHMSDQYGTGSFSHSPDTSVGGTDDIVEFAGSETSGETIIEFKIPLDSGDTKDKTLNPSSSYKVLVAYHSSDDNFISKHTKKGSITISLD